MKGGTVSAVHAGATLNWAAPAAVERRQDCLEILFAMGYDLFKENPYSERNHYAFLCPFHNDGRNPSFYIHADKKRWYCFGGCGTEIDGKSGGGPAKLLKMFNRGGPTPGFPKPPKPAKTTAKRKERPTGCTLAQLSPAKRLPVPLLKEWGHYDTDWHGTPAIGIPDADGNLCYRVGLTGDRFRRRKGDSVGLYGKERIQYVDREVVYVEGQTDPIALEMMGGTGPGCSGSRELAL